MTDKPTDEALENLFVEETGFDIDDFPAAIFGFARAVLAKWGQPAQAAEPVAWLDPWTGTKVTTDYDAYGKHGIPLYTAPQPVAREPQCWCLTCRPMRFEDPYSIRMALCPTCGNKRCPKANDHRNTCTGSNEPGQPGSAYFGGIKGGQHGTE